ncbi:putative chloride channel-like protein CLC-g [Iris pallida]|uniref:Chloride channel-like protein CLC-g n=1 Tax=Iris pallida TaxID=29817 RepID=A0AAX6G120_IRIPA|nr:putative chloride channel-like protein CLC-g [Iris pallida]
MRKLTVSDIVTGLLQMFHRVEKVGNIVHILETTGHNGFPVIDEPLFLVRLFFLSLFFWRTFLCAKEEGFSTFLLAGSF